VIARVALALRYTLVALAVLLALITGAGRLFMAWLDEDRAHTLLARLAPAVPITLHGAEFGWHHLNPRVSIETLTLGDSQVRGLVVELDWMESLARRALVLGHLGNREAMLRFERGPQGQLSLAGMPAGEGSLPWRGTLEHSDQLALQAALYLAAPGQGYAPLGVSLRATNRRAKRRWSVRVADTGCDVIARCALQLEAEEFLAVPLWQGASLAISSRLGEDGLTLPRALLGNASLHLTRAAIRWDATQRDWRQADTPLGSSAGNDDDGAPVAGRLDLDLALHSVELPGGVPFALSLTASGSSHPGFAVARSFDATLAVGDTAVALPELWMRWLPERLQLFTAAVDLERALGQVARTRSEDDQLGLWLRALAIRGELSRLQLQADLADGTVAWAARLADGGMSGFQGAPTVSGFNGELVGYERGLAAQIQAGSGVVGFPDVFSDLWPVASFRARMQLHWRDAGLALLGEEIEAALAEAGSAEPRQVTGRFRLAVPGERLEQTLALQLAAPVLSVDLARRFVPSKINPDLKRWLRTAPRAGQLADVTFAYHGYVRGGQGPAARRSALTAQLRRGELVFDERWPVLEGIEGRFDLSGQRAAFRTREASSLGVSLAGSQVMVPPGARSLTLALAAQGDGQSALRYVRESPLQQTLPFIAPQWQAQGPLGLSGTLKVPLGASATGEPRVTQADLRIALADASLTMPEERLSLTGLTGEAQFRTPGQLTCPRLDGRLHDEPVTASIETVDDTIRFVFQGEADPDLAYRVLDVPDPGFARGRTGYTGYLAFPPAPAGPQLVIETALTGIALDLPGELAKDEADRRSTRVEVDFLDERTEVGVAQRVLDAALIVTDAGLRGGRVRLRGSAAGLPQSHVLAADSHGRGITDTRRLAITGALAELPLAAGGAEGGLFGATPVLLDSLEIGHLLAGDADLGPVALSGTMDGPALAIAAFGDQVRGRFTQTADSMLDVDLDFLQLPDVAEGAAPLAELDVRLVTDPDRLRERVTVDTRLAPEEDPLPVALIDELPAARVRVAELMLGADPFGRWAFELAPEPGVIRILELDAQVRGLTIAAPELSWHAQPNETRFSGELTAQDLATVLPQWDYAASLSTEAARVRATVRWPGSPANINLLTADGSANFRADNGRFLEIDSGSNALRIFSLLNFSAFAKRMNLDFSDVLGRGVSFEKLTAPVSLASGDMRFTEPMAMEGTGSKFRLSGTVDLDTGALNNEMVVTLPLTKGLPWYAAYVALANPLAGLGVLVGERMLRKPLEQFSSARYRVTGTLDEPKARLVSIFDNDMSTELPADGSAVPAPDTEPVTADQEENSE
jgi:uncharacterized protein YhdP